MEQRFISSCSVGPLSLVQSDGLAASNAILLMASGTSLSNYPGYLLDVPRESSLEGEMSVLPRKHWDTHKYSKEIALLPLERFTASLRTRT